MLKQQHVPYRMQLMGDGYIEPSTLQNDQNSNPGLLQLAVCVCVLFCRWYVVPCFALCRDCVGGNVRGVSEVRRPGLLFWSFCRVDGSIYPSSMSCIL